MYCFANWLEERKADTVLLRVIPSLEGQTVLSLVNEMELLLILMGTIVLCLEVAFRLGLRMRVRTDEANRAHVNALQAALLGLLALLLGFTFAMAVSRFDTRKSLVLAEANAIGTVGLRASLLPPAERAPFLGDLRDYVDARLMFYDAGTDKERIDASISRTTEIQNRLWTIAAAAAAGESNSIPFGLLLQSLNELFDLAEQRQVALENRVPESVLYLLFAVTVGALGFISYGSGLAGRRYHVSTAIFAMLVSLVLITIIDFDRPREGLIRISQQSLSRVQAQLSEAARP